MSNLLDRPDVKYPSRYGRELTIDDAKKPLSKNGEEVRVLETPICFIRDTNGRKYHETIKYYSARGFVYAHEEDGSVWGQLHPGYTAEFEDGTIWTAPEKEPNKALMEFILQRQNKTVILEDEDDFVV